MSVTRLGSEFTITTSTGYNSNGAQITPLSNGAHLVDWIYGWDSVDPADSRARIYTSSRTAVGNDFQVAADPTFYTHTTPLSNGNFVITWATSGVNPEVKAQIYTNAGATVGSQISVNTITSGAQYGPQVAALEGGGFVVMFQNESTDLRAQIFSNAGAAVGSEFVVQAAATQHFTGQMTGLPGGGFVIAWCDNASNSGDVRAQVFDATGGRVGAEFVVNTTATGSQYPTNIVVLANGDYAVFWYDGPSTGMKGQVFTGSGGTKVGSEFTVETTADSHTQNELEVVALDGGGFVASWWARVSSGADTDQGSVKAQLFAADGSKVGGEIAVNTTTTGNQIFPNIAATPDGGFVIVWSDNHPGNDGQGTGVRGQAFNADGSRDGAEFLANTTTADNQANPDVARTNDGFLITWFEGNGANPDLIRGQYFDVTIPPNVVTSGGSTAYEEPSDDHPGTPALAVDANLALSDADSSTLASATVSITGGFEAGDTLAFTNSSAATFGNIAASYDAATGVLTLTSSGGTATVAQWQAALRAVTFDTDQTPDSGARAVSFSVSDGGETSAAANKTITVTPNNDFPHVTGVSGTVAFTENGGPVVIEPSAVVSDPDTTLSGAQVGFDNGTFVAGQDVLAFTNSSAATFGNITASFNATTGLLSLTSAGNTATIAQWQAALRAVTYSNTSDAPDTTTREFIFYVQDTAASNTATSGVSVTVAAANDLPVLGGAGGTTAYTEGGSPAVASGLTVADADNANLSGASVTISANFQASEDRLNFTNQNGITGSYDAATGVLTLTGSASVADYQAALRSVTYSNSSDAPSAASRTVSFVVNDGTGNATAATQTVTVAAISDAPTLAGAGGSSAYTEDGAGVAVVPSLTVADVDSANLTGATVSITGGFQSGADALHFTNQNGITGSFNATTGVLTLSGSASLANYQTALRSITFSNGSNTPSTAARTVSITVTDGATPSSTATQTVTVTAVNDAPSGADATLNIQVGASRTFTAADFGFSDVDGHTLNAVTITTLPAAGSLTLNGVAVTAGQSIAVSAINAGHLVYTPGAASAQAAFAIFTFQVQDSGGTANGGVNLDASANTITVNVTAAPAPPPSDPEPSPPPPVGTAGDDVIVLDTTVRAYDAGAGDDNVTGSYMPDTLSGGEGNDSLFGGAGDDQLSGGPGRNVLRGGDGEDSLIGGSDFDDLHGNIGDDTVRGGGGGDWVVGGQGQDMLYGDEGGDVLLGNLGQDVLFAGEGDDVARGGQGNDSVSGGAGNDWLAGDRGSDTLSGGAGADIFHTWGEAGLDVVVDFNAAEGDRINLLPGTEHSFAQVGADVVITMTGGGQMVLQGVQLSALPPGWIF